MEINLKESIIKGKKGDQQALTQIYNATNKLVYFTALKFLQNENDAQDLVQETYIKVFQNIGSLQDENAFPKWLKTITSNLCKNYLKKRKPMLFETVQKQEEKIEGIPEINENFLPEEYAQQKEKSRLVMEIIDNLPDLQRVAVLLYYFDELSIGEIATIMETSEGTIKSRLNYGRKQIKDKVEQLDKKGTKLYGISAVPILITIFLQVSEDYFLSEAAEQAILSNALDASIKTIGSVSTGGQSPSTITRFMSSSVTTKVIAGITAVSLVVGATYGINHIIKHKQIEKKQEYQAVFEEKMFKKMNNYEIESLIGKKQDEIISIWGKPDQINENQVQNQKIFKYSYKVNGGALIELEFMDDSVTHITCYRGKFSIKGIKSGDSLDSAKAVFNKISNAVLEKDAEKCGDFYSTRYYIDKYGYQFIYDEKEKVHILGISKMISHSYAESQKSTKGTITAAIEPAVLFEKTEKEIIAILGEPHEKDNDELTYLDVNSSELSLSFKQGDEKVSTLYYDGNLLSLGGLTVPIGDTVDDVRNYLKSNTTIKKIDAEEQVLFDSNKYFNFYKDDYKYEVLLDKDKRTYRVFVSLWDRKGEQDVLHQKYKDYFMKHYGNENAQAFFADLTHDGEDEMIIIYGDDREGQLNVITFDKNNQGQDIYSGNTATTTNQQRNFKLYTEDGKTYLLTDASFQRQGFPMEYYKIFSLTKDGQEKVLSEKTIEYSINSDGTLKGTTEEELDVFDNTLQNYQHQSLQLLSIRNGDIVYGKGENFTSRSSQ